MKPYYYIPKDRLSGIDRYRYEGVDKSLMSRYILTPYWNHLVQLFPLWMAPNMITLLGFLTIVLNVATLFYYTSDLAECPHWVYYSFSLGLFLYQSLDAIDGKQARRTGTSGPLGELFDHGCDALNTSLSILTWASATGLGQSWWTVGSLWASLANFYLSTWQEYHTGHLYLGYFSGPVEGLLILCAIHFFSGYFGPAIWTTRLNEILTGLSPHSVLGYFQLNHLLVVFGALVLLYNILSGLHQVLRSHPSFPTALFGLGPFVSLSLWGYLWLTSWPDLVTDHLALFIPFYGLLFGHQVGLMITAHVAQMPFPFIDLPVTFLLMSGWLLAKYEAIVEE
ncbi:hypothetical protein G6F37_011159 [Rhizopus arrhizus]|nr:hypothetical protein G6F38_005543 [Rhizopus arrhizus]KAG1150633.1 hypothetical protein G6F37_011159 [Rhizopus arrhizus]